jgi:hypothetical protein
MQVQIGYVPIEFIVISSVGNMVCSDPLECILIQQLTKKVSKFPYCRVGQAPLQYKPKISRLLGREQTTCHKYKPKLGSCHKYKPTINNILWSWSYGSSN